MSAALDDEKTLREMAEISAAPEFEAVEALKAVKAGHADDVDIAARILADNIDVIGNETWSVAEDKKLIRKVDWRLIPIVSLRASAIAFGKLRVDGGIAVCMCNSLWTG